MNIQINPEKQFQRIEGFGASGAWWAQIVGGWEHIDPARGKPGRAPRSVNTLLFFLFVFH